MFLRINAKFEPGAVKRNFCRSIWTVCTTCTISLLPGIMNIKKNYNDRKGIIQNKEKSPEIDNKTQT